MSLVGSERCRRESALQYVTYAYQASWACDTGGETDTVIQGGEDFQWSYVVDTCGVSNPFVDRGG